MCAAAAASGRAAVGDGSTLNAVRRAAAVECGINRAEADYSKDDTHGNLAAFGADICKAVGVAVLGRGARVVVKSYPDEPHALRALQTRAVSLVAGATPSVSHRADYALGFGPTILFDSQGFIVADGGSVTTLRDFAGKQICYIANTAADVNLNAAFAASHIAFLPFPFEEQGEMEAALFTGHCAAVTGDLSQLADIRYGFRGGADRFRILDAAIAQDPLAPAYRADDARWAAVVDGTMDLLIQAEASGITAANVETLRHDPDPAVRRLLGTTPGIGRALGLEPDWAVAVIQAVGNYGEIFERDLGPRSPLGMERGVNKPWTQGGLLVARPFH